MPSNMTGETRRAKRDWASWRDQTSEASWRDQTSEARLGEPANDNSSGV